MKLTESIPTKPFATATGATLATAAKGAISNVAVIATVAVANHELDSKVIRASHHHVSVLRWWIWKAVLLGGEIIATRQWRTPTLKPTS